MIRILWLRPVNTPEYNTAISDLLETGKADDTEITVKALERGPRHLEYHYYSALVLSDMLREVKKAEQSGFDGVVLACFYDGGLREGREIAESIVVTAPGESAMQIAASLGRRFSIIVGDRKWIPRMQDNVARYGFRERLASFKSVDLGVLEFQTDREETARRIEAAANEAVERDMAEVIVLGCTMEFGFHRVLQERLGIPVVDAVLAPLKYTEFLIELKKRLSWGVSKAFEYRTPPVEEIKEWDLERQYGLGEIW